MFYPTIFDPKTSTTFSELADVPSEMAPRVSLGIIDDQYPDDDSRTIVLEMPQDFLAGLDPQDTIERRWGVVRGIADALNRYPDRH